MIRVLMLDLGGTLERGGDLLPHVPEALAALRGFETEDGELLSLCLVSDFHMPAQPGDPSEIADIFSQYLSILDGLGLRSFFEPVERHVTLSTHAGAFKPDRRVFEVALRRLEQNARLEEVLLITENAEHVRVCREQHGMSALLFGPPGSPGVDFSDWSEAPILVSRVVAPESEFNAQSALKTHLAALHGLEVMTMKKTAAKARLKGRAKKWVPVRDPMRGGDEKLHVPLAVDVEVEVDDDGRVRSVESGQPAPETLDEAAHYVGTLEANRQIAHDDDIDSSSEATHAIETDKEGKRRLVRKRFSAI